MSKELKERKAVASVTRAFEDLHALVDQSIASGANLMIKALEARELVGASGTIMQNEMEAMHFDLGVLVQARRSYIARHAQMTELSRELGLPVFADGGFTKLPKMEEVEAGQAMAA